MDPITIAMVSASGLAGLGLAAWATLKGWQGWLELKKMELTQHFAEGPADRTVPQAGGRIEIADLRERVRKLEAIAAGIDL